MMLAIVALGARRDELPSRRWAASRARIDSAEICRRVRELGHDRPRDARCRHWEKWLKQPPSSVLGVDFYAQSTWDDYSGLSWVPGIWKKLNPARNVVWSVPLTVKGTPLADVADGLHDAEFEAAASAIAEAQPKAIIRLGWEMNLATMAWFARGPGGRLHPGVPARGRRSSGDTRRTSSTTGVRDGDRRTAPPISPIPATMWSITSASMSTISNMRASAEERWDTFYLKAPFGLEWHRDFAARHGKPMSYPEWGVGQFGDNPFFIQQMHDWFADHQDSIAYAAYFDVDGLWPTQIDNDRFPNSERLFRKLFSRHP